MTDYEHIYQQMKRPIILERKEMYGTEKCDNM